MFRVKICGVRLQNDVEVAGESGADAIGLNFFPPSVRFVDPDAPETAELSKSAAAGGLLRVGVFVNESADRITEIAAGVGLDAIQLHGDEPAEVADALIGGGHRVIRAIKLPRGEFGPETVDRAAAQWLERGCRLILDVDAGAAHGGSGKTLDWGSVRRWAEASPAAGWTLAGGLKPENIGEAIVSSGAGSVDTASGVECPRGVKNSGRVRQFAEGALAAFQAAEQSRG